ncbi:hypothetical protein [Embleya sp. NPDC020630]|uniref:hypothetical protein n=1 Tax=Embleya sp. NPDC020630 TaxID=3363979 RepID=UPI0037BBB51E
MGAIQAPTPAMQDWHTELRTASCYITTAAPTAMTLDGDHLRIAADLAPSLVAALDQVLTHPMYTGGDWEPEPFALAPPAALRDGDDVLFAGFGGAWAPNELRGDADTLVRDCFEIAYGDVAPLRGALAQL